MRRAILLVSVDRRKGREVKCMMLFGESFWLGMYGWTGLEYYEVGRYQWCFGTKKCEWDLNI